MAIKDELWYIHEMEYYTAMKMNKLQTHAWMNLINIPLNKRSHTKD